MTYASVEISEYSGQPGEYFAFTSGATVYRYTSSDADATISGQAYTAVPVRRDALSNGREINSSNLEVYLPANVALAQEFISGPPSAPITVVVSRKHTSDAEVITPFRGVVVNFEFKEDELVLTCQSVFASLKRPLLSRLFQVACPYALYGASCGVSKATYEESITLSGVSTVTLSSAAFSGFADGYFSGGYISYNTGTRTITRNILSHVSTDIVIDYQIPGLPGNAGILAYPGCAHNITVCDSKFSNKDNYGGQPFFPDKNPFGTDPVF